MYSPHFIHLPTDGHLECFHLLAVVNNAATDTGVQSSVLLCDYWPLLERMSRTSCLHGVHVPEPSGCFFPLRLGAEALMQWCTPCFGGAFGLPLLFLHQECLFLFSFRLLFLHSLQLHEPLICALCSCYLQCL